ncbi:MAG: addiction module antitoxin RelB [Acidobacteria bacterium]|nr:MAG: addiction module antitoxin RelB [Acidobacteriota bacterium]RLE33183.1 MAG: addiction module antitoxin RelB [Acidobacteriota bacterium]
MENTEPLFRQVFELPLDKRAELAARLLKSLDDLSDQEAEILWAAEAERRLHDLQNGQAKSIPADEVLRKAERLLND